MDDVVTIPISVTYRIINGEAVKISAEYANIGADTLARFLLDAFRVAVER